MPEFPPYMLGFSSHPGRGEEVPGACTPGFSASWRRVGQGTENPDAWVLSLC